MSKVSSVRWNDETLYQHAKQFAELNNKKLNTIMLEAIKEYLINHSEDATMSELYRQTQQHSRAHDAADFDLNSWANNQDDRDWE